MCLQLGALWGENISLISELLPILVNCGCSMWAYLVTCWRRRRESGGAPVQSHALSAAVEQELGGSGAAQLQAPSAPAGPADELGWRGREQRPRLGLSAGTGGCGRSGGGCPGHPQRRAALVPAPALSPLFSQRIWP